MKNQERYTVDGGMGTKASGSGSTFNRILNQVTFWRLVALMLLAILALAALLATLRVQAAREEYRAAVDQVEAIHTVAVSEDVLMLSRHDLLWLENEFTILEERIHRLEEMSRLPFGIDAWISEWRWVEPRYDAAMDTFDLGLMLAESGRTISGIGAEAIAALDEQGVRQATDQDGETWLDVIHRRESELLAALDQIDLAMTFRHEIDEAYLPDRIRYRLASIDAVMEQFSEQLALTDDLPLAHTLLGTFEPQRYLVLFQNPAELRPTGGFPGTIALVELHRGQLVDVEFFDIYLLSSDYLTNVQQPVRAPWALNEFVRSDGLQIQDANWWADFPRTARQVLEMYSVAGWPEVHGVVAIQPDLVGDMMSITGPIDVEVAEETRTITPENLLDEAERQRRIYRESGDYGIAHKEVVALIGEELVDHLSTGDRGELIDLVYILIGAVERRDMQIYFMDEDAQSFIAERGWDGRLIPDPDIPTIAPILANITGNKSSLAMQSSMLLEILEPATEGRIELRLTFTTENRGDETGDPFYEGFQRSWLEMLLPQGSRVFNTQPEQAPDPNAMNGGGYVLRQEPGDQRDTIIRFSMPETDSLLIRHQPGLAPPPVIVDDYRCGDPVESVLARDLILQFGSECPWFQVESNGDEP